MAVVECLIIAAGKGSRLKGIGNSKPLIPVLGVPLIERVIRSAVESGVDEFYVTTGYNGKLVRSFLAGLSTSLRVRITPIVNRDWRKGNGLSVLKAREYVHGPFLLLMADQLFDPSIARKLKEVPLGEGEIALAVDKGMSNPLIDMEDVTRVKTEGDRIRDIGKGLRDFDGFDTGIFLCTSGIFGAVERCAEEHGDTSLSGAVRVLAADERAKAVEITGRFWIDVDDLPALRRAEKALVANLGEKSNDGPVSRYLNRPISLSISRRLANRRITPNQISLFSFLCSVLAAGLFVQRGYLALLLGGLLAQFASIIDGCDGEVARLKFRSSAYGGWLDAVLDRYADAFLLFCLTWHAFRDRAESGILWAGFLAVIGSFVVSYTADKYDSLMAEKVGRISRLRLGRDMRVFVVFLGAIANQAYLALVVIATVMNIEAIRRIVICRDRG
ncbi:MAG: NTP transferase domain-containing protein [Deltaproteobacteria bacterium]|nr:NTP transferase domain-containing protein [Deltaproteobacteria bacterium]